MSSDLKRQPSHLVTNTEAQNESGAGAEGNRGSNPPMRLSAPPEHTNSGEDPNMARKTPSINIKIADEKESLSEEREEGEKRYSDYSDSTADRELYLHEYQKVEFKEKLLSHGIQVPLDERGKMVFTKTFVKSLPKSIGHAIMTASYDADDGGRHSFSEGSNWSGSDSETAGQEEEQQSLAPSVPEVILQIKYTPSGLGYIVDDTGNKFHYEEITKHLENAFTEGDLQKQEEHNHEKDGALLSVIRKERREEEKNSALKKADSILVLQEMSLRYIPGVNTRPKKGDPITVFEHIPSNAKKSTMSYQHKIPQTKGLEVIHLLDPRDYTMGRVDSFATVPSTIARKFSNATVRGSMLSTHLSDMPSTYSQALLEEPSSVMFASNTQQEFDITPSSAAKFRERWLTNFVKGTTPKHTFSISIINLITRRNIEMRVCKEYTLNEICHLYMQYEDHPEYYVWKDIYGRVLSPYKTLVENGMMANDEKMEYQGYRKLPVILLYFKDGFENEPPAPLNPIHAMNQKEIGPCRNY